MSLKKGPERGPNGILISHKFILDPARIEMARLLGIEGIKDVNNIMQYNYNKKWWQLNATPLSDYEEFVILNHEEEGYSLHWREAWRAKEIIGDDDSSPNWGYEILLHFVKEPHHDSLQWILYQGDAYWILSPEEVASIFL
jgi:hypothetical protein